MAAASGGAGKGVRGFSAWWEGPLWATTTLLPLPLNTSPTFLHRLERPGSAWLSRWSLQKPKKDEATSALPNGYYAFIETSDQAMPENSPKMPRNLFSTLLYVLLVLEKLV